MEQEDLGQRVCKAQNNGNGRRIGSANLRISAALRQVACINRVANGANSLKKITNRLIFRVIPTSSVGFIVSSLTRMLRGLFPMTAILDFYEMILRLGGLPTDTVELHSRLLE